MSAGCPYSTLSVLTWVREHMSHLSSHRIIFQKGCLLWGLLKQAYFDRFSLAIYRNLFMWLQACASRGQHRLNTNNYLNTPTPSIWTWGMSVKFHSIIFVLWGEPDLHPSPASLHKSKPTALVYFNYWNIALNLRHMINCFCSRLNVRPPNVILNK